MSYRAWAYICGVLLIGLLLGAQSFIPSSLVDDSQIALFVILSIFATLSQLFKVEAPSHQTYYATLIFIFAGLYLLPPAYFVLMVVIAYLGEWSKERLAGSALFRNWYLQPFNIATAIISGLAARALYDVIHPLVIDANVPSRLLAAIFSAALYVLCSHLIIAVALMLARKVSLRDSGLFSRETLLVEFILLCLGYVVTILWNSHNSWMIPLALAPLVLMYQALKIPALRKEAETDGKTGLLNATYFNRLLTAELSRAKRFGHSLSFIMGDLDLLRNINNTYGHLAGDAVLAGIGQIIRETIREYDLAGRYGGEEFAIVLPETERAETLAFAERLRRKIEAYEFQVPTSSTLIHVTMSMGVACHPVDGDTPVRLVHAADIAVYQAKLQGRNRVVSTTDVPQSAKLEMPPMAERVEAPYLVAFSPHPGTSQEESASQTPAEQSPVLPPIAPAVLDLTPPRREASVNKYPRVLLPLFIASVIMTGVLLAVSAYLRWPPANMNMIPVMVLAGLALIFATLRMDMYGESGTSVTLATNFAAALIAGIPGVAIVSAAMSFGDRLGMVRAGQFNLFQSLYKAPFNWAVYVLSGAVPALVVQYLKLSVQVENALLLLLVLVPAAFLCYFIETGTIAIAIALSSQASVVRVWTEHFKWLVTQYLVLCITGIFVAMGYLEAGLVGILVFILPVLVMRYTQKEYVSRTEHSVLELKRMNEELGRANSEVLGANRSIQQLNDELFMTLSKIIDARDPYVSGHAAQVSEYATAIAQELGLPPSRIEIVRQAAFLHDIGKIGISEQVLHKPSRLTPEEYKYIQIHSALGAEFLNTSRGLRQLAPFVRHHHEWWNGKGYPDGLRGEEIPLESRILAICDAVEAMASDRAYHRGLSLSEIVQELKRCVEVQFDPTLVDVFVLIAARRGERLIVNSAREVRQKSGHAEPFTVKWFVEDSKSNGGDARK